LLIRSARMAFTLAAALGFLVLTCGLTVCLILGDRFLAFVDEWVRESVKPAIAARLDKRAEPKA
jgi:hypothetical protein